MSPSDPRQRYDDLLEFTNEEELAASEFAEAAASEPARIGWVVLGIVFDEDERILLIKQPWADGWLFPGGVPKSAETLSAAVVREVAEETGVRVDPRRPHAVDDLTIREAEDNGTTGWSTVFFEAVAESTTPDRNPNVDDETATAIRWFDDLPADCFNKTVTEQVFRRCRRARSDL